MMRMRTILATALVVLFGSVAVALPGEGTESNPFQISTEADLLAVNDALDAHYVLMNDINLTGSYTKALIAYDDDNIHGQIPLVFTGSFDGNNKAIRNLTITGLNHIALFGSIQDGGTVFDLTVENVNVTGNYRVAGLVGRNSGGVVDNCAVVGGTINGTFIDQEAFDGNVQIGGLVGWNNGTITNSSAAVTVTAIEWTGGLVGRSSGGQIVNCSFTGSVTAGNIVGGLVGANYGLIADSVVENAAVVGNGEGRAGGLSGTARTGSIITGSSVSGTTVQGVNWIGGLIGISTNGSIVIDSHSTASVTGDGTELATRGAGGLIGRAENSYVLYCSSTGDVTELSSIVSSGGLIGITRDSIVTGCFSTSHVSGGGDCGGLIGTAWGSVLTRCYAVGSVTDGLYTAGGLVGYNDGSTIQECFAAAAISSASFNQGGLLGDNTGVIKNSFWDTQVSGLTFSPGGGTGLTTAEMKDVDEFLDAGWLFMDTVANTVGYWVMPADEYPVLAEVADLFDGGDGTPGNPYQIATLQQLRFVNANLLASYILVNDIEFVADPEQDTAAVIAPHYGGSSNDFEGMPYSGVFDGDGFAIKDLALDGSDDNFIALFGAIGAGGQVLNLTLENAVVSGARNVAGLAGQNAGTISNCTVEATVEAVGRFAAGLVGDSNGQILDSHSSGSVTSSGVAVGGLVGRLFSGGLISGSSSQSNLLCTEPAWIWAGGLVGICELDTTTIVDSYATGDVVCPGEASRHVGGFVGRATDTTNIENCSASGDVTADGGTVGAYLGGFVGSYANNTGTISNSHASGNVTAASRYVGGFVGICQGYMTGCSASGNVVSSGELSRDIGGFAGNISASTTVDNNHATGDVEGEAGFIGGFAGYMSSGSSIHYCYAEGKVDSIRVTGGASASGTRAGGLVGESQGVITNSYATGLVIGNLQHAGGLVGRNDAPISDSYATGNVIGSSQWSGGLVGRHASGLISNSYATGDVTAANRDIGGLIGRMDADTSVSQSYATGNVSCSGGSFIGGGGLVGDNYGAISDSYATGNVTTTLFNRSGGIVGFNRGGASIVNAYATGSVGPEGSDGGHFGGIAGANAGAITDCFWDVETSGLTDGIGEHADTGVTGVTTAQMLTAATFTGWDFVNVWFNCEGFSYPRLTWQEFAEADINLDGAVNITDLHLLAEYWLQSASGLCVDIDGDGVVDLADFAMLASDWLVE